MAKKELIIDFELYMADLSRSRLVGYRDAVSHMRTLIDDLLSGKSIEDALAENDLFEYEPARIISNKVYSQIKGMKNQPKTKKEDQ